MNIISNIRGTIPAKTFKIQLLKQKTPVLRLYRQQAHILSLFCYSYVFYNNSFIFFVTGFAAKRNSVRMINVTSCLQITIIYINLKISHALLKSYCLKD